jgi:hypothetical protein
MRKKTQEPALYGQKKRCADEHGSLPRSLITGPETGKRGKEESSKNTESAAETTSIVCSLASLIMAGPPDRNWEKQAAIDRNAFASHC